MLRKDPVRIAYEKRTYHDKVRLYDHKQGCYLHMTGEITTTNVEWSWLGTRIQAQTLRERALTRGEEFPYKIVSR